MIAQDTLSSALCGQRICTAFVEVISLFPYILTEHADPFVLSSPTLTLRPVCPAKSNNSGADSCQMRGTDLLISHEVKQITQKFSNI